MQLARAIQPSQVMSRVSSISTSASCNSRDRQPSDRQRCDAASMRLARAIQAVLQRSYIRSRAYEELPAGGVQIVRRCVARRRREAWIVRVSRQRRAAATTVSSEDRRPVRDLVRRSFTADAPDMLRRADLTFLPITGGLLPMTVALYALSRRVVCWSYDNDRDPNGP